MDLYRFFFRNWWVIAFIVMAGAVYLQAFHNKKELVSRLKKIVASLQEEKQVALQEREELISRRQSREDPEWIELVLKEKLGVVSEGEEKVVFQ